MKNYIQPGLIMEYQNAGSAITAGSVVVIGGNKVGVASTDIAATTGKGSVYVEGVFLVDKATSQAWAQGAILYWDNSAHKFTTTSGGNVKAGIAWLAALSADTTGQVKLSADRTV